jgi:FKBP-type peptidyl-prolyl cis-trans isomerase FklB
MRKAFYRSLFVPSAGLLFCGMALAQQSSAPSSTQQPSATKPATTTTPKKATTPPAKKPLTLDTQKDKASYAIGLNIGRSMKKDDVDVDPEIIARGMKDALTGAKPLLTDEETQTVLNTLQTDVRKHQQELYQQAVLKNKEQGDAFLATNKAKTGVVTLPSGLQYKVIQNGDGPKPAASDTVVCNYRGTLIDGTEFDSSYKRGKPATFAVGQVIKGWTEALQLMPVGSKWELYIPPNLAYGERGTPNGGPIGPNSTLIFDVELVSIQAKPQPKLETPGGQATAPQAQPQSQPQAQSQPQQPQSQAQPQSLPQAQQPAQSQSKPQ